MQAEAVLHFPEVSMYQPLMIQKGSKVSSESSRLSTAGDIAATISLMFFSE